MRICVTGAGGFVGHHLVVDLKSQGHWVRGVDLHLPEFDASPADEFLTLDLRDRFNAYQAVISVEQVYALAADMGGMGFISQGHYEILTNNLRINLNTLDSALRHNSVKRYFFSSSACAYPTTRLTSTVSKPLKEREAIPANPQAAYGWEKLITEKMCEYVRGKRKLSTCFARFFNTYGPLCAWKGGREKAPAAICRKIAKAKALGEDEIEIWGDGKQTRAYTYISDTVKAIQLITNSEFPGPMNVGIADRIALNDLVDMVMDIAEYEVRVHHVCGPLGVRGRSPDNSIIKAEFQWEPTVSFREGMEKLYPWVEEQVRNGLP